MVANPVSVPLEILYDADFVEWTEEMARRIEGKRTDEFDWDHLAEEIRDLGISQKHAVASHLDNLLLHLVKWEIQPNRRGRSWEESISNARRKISRLVEDTPSLKRHLEQSFDDSYVRAARWAMEETHLPETTPFTRWSKDQVLAPGFLPE